MIQLFLKRLARRIKHIPQFLKEILFWKYETCLNCGCVYRVLWNVEDCVWEKVFGDKEFPGCFCIDCFIKIAEKKGIQIKREEFTILEPFYPNKK